MSHDQGPSAPAEVTRLLEDHRQGREDALDELFQLVYRELLQLARAQRRRLSAGETMDSVALVHDCYLRLAHGSGLAARDRGHFFASVAQAMRHILVDYARSRHRAKRKGEQASVDPDALGVDQQIETILAVHQALDRVAAIDPRLVRVAECRYFAGLSTSETAEALGVSTATVERAWKAVRAYLGQLLGP